MVAGAGSALLCPTKEFVGKENGDHSLEETHVRGDYDVMPFQSNSGMTIRRQMLKNGLVATE